MLTSCSNQIFTFSHCLTVHGYYQDKYYFSLTSNCKPSSQCVAAVADLSLAHLNQAKNHHDHDGHHAAHTQYSPENTEYCLFTYLANFNLINRLPQLVSLNLLTKLI